MPYGSRNECTKDARICLARQPLVEHHVVDWTNDLAKEKIAPERCAWQARLGHGHPVDLLEVFRICSQSQLRDEVDRLPIRWMQSQAGHSSLPTSTGLPRPGWSVFQSTLCAPGMTLRNNKRLLNSYVQSLHTRSLRTCRASARGKEPGMQSQRTVWLWPADCTKGKVPHLSMKFTRRLTLSVSEM